MADRYPLIANSETNRIEELAAGDNLNLSDNGIVGATTVTADKFIGDLKGIAQYSTALIDGSQILSGTISSERLAGHYNIGVNTAIYLESANNILSGTLSTSRLAGKYNIDITGTAQTANYLQDASNINEGILSSDRLAGVYNISITGTSFNTEVSASAAGLFGEPNIEVGIVTATEYYGSGVNIAGIVTQIVAGIGVSVFPTNGSGKVTIDAYRPVGKTIFVHQNGDDINTGLSENYAKRTIKSAASIAKPGDTIKVYPGVYVENNPIVLNRSVSIEGAELRNCMISPQHSNLDLFHVNNGCHITDLSFVGSSSTNGASVITFQPLSGVASDRFFDAARMIRLNLDFIANEAVGYITSTDYKNPNFEILDNLSNRCAEDIKLIFKAVCHDITRGGNSKCVGAGLTYYSESGLQHIVGVKTETIDAIRYAAGIARSCINNVPWTGNYQSKYTQVKDLSIQKDLTTNSNEDIGSCSNVISAVYSCVGVVTTIIDKGLSVLGAGINTTYPGNNGIGTTNPNDSSFSPGVGQITQGPYIRNCTNFIPNSIGMKVDGFAAEPGDQDDIGVTGSMSVDSYTQYNQGGIGVSITNGAYAQLVSIFTICDDTAIFTGSGGQCDITNSNSSFGRFGLVSNGVGDEKTKSIYRYTGTVVENTPRRTNVVEISGVGNYRPYDGQVCYFGELYYSIDTIEVVNGGSGYTVPPRVAVQAPEGPNGITAQATSTIENGKVVAINILNVGTQYKTPPIVTIAGPTSSGTTATAIVSKLQPIYYKVSSATLPSVGISTVTLLQNLNNDVSLGTTVYFSRVSLQIASSHSFEWVGSGNDINKAKPALGGVVITDNEVVQENGGVVIYTSTDQSGNFNIGDGVVINQSTGAISGRDFNKALFTTMTPFILALSD